MAVATKKMVAMARSPSLCRWRRKLSTRCTLRVLVPRREALTGLTEKAGCAEFISQRIELLLCLSAQMGEQWFKSCLPDEYYEKFIAEGIYPDGRSISAFRPLFFKLGAWGGVGSALVKLGGASVSCTVEASLALIHDGPFVFCEIDACASVTQAQVNDVADLLNKVFTNESLSFRSALLVKGIDKEVVMTWELTLRVQILNSDGSILDAVFCAVSAALFDVRLPSVTLKHAKDDESPLRQEEISIHEETTSLALESFPIAFTFHVFKSNNKDY
ncbi:hypothetical protein TELCIR_12921, partial [Teladorsagia circumcincta]